MESQSEMLDDLVTLGNLHVNIHLSGLMPVPIYLRVVKYETISFNNAGGSPFIMFSDLM